MSEKIIVIKFGSSILSSESAIATAIHEVYRYLRENYKIIVVISAIGSTTDDLENRARKIIDDETSEPEPQAFAALLATGEIAAASLFAIALNHAGIPAFKLDHHCLETKGPVLDAEPFQLRKKQVLEAFQKYPVLVLPGFIGVEDGHFVTLLGRGGSDFTAIFTACELDNAECVLYKDTNGIYNLDPETHAKEALPYQKISYADCLKIPYPVVQYKAVRFAEKNGFRFTVKSLGSQEGTEVGSGKSVLAVTNPSNQVKRKLKVVLLGLGTVGYGVYRHLSSAPDLFEIVGVGIKNLSKHHKAGIPLSIISTNFGELLDRDCDVVIELIGKPILSEQCITEALCKKRHVVTANKLLIAEVGTELQSLADKNGVKLLYSGAVAGSVPILEALLQIKKTKSIKSISGILNGTCNFILDQCSQGKTFADALALAQRAGFAEADPSLDIDGRDAAQKLTILARLAFNEEMNDFHVEGIKNVDAESIQNAFESKKSIKLIAEVTREEGGLKASVKPVALSESHPFAKISGSENAILIESTDGEIVQLRGKGAGRWPTAEAVFADIFDLSRLNQESFAPSQNDALLISSRARVVI